MTIPNYDFLSELETLRECPLNSAQTLVKLDALRRYAHSFRACDPLTAAGHRYSKRRARLIRMFHAFRVAECRR